MTDANSPVADFYPTQFRVDMEGKRNDWEGVVLVPFIEEARLLAAHNTVGHNKLAPVCNQRHDMGILSMTYSMGSPTLLTVADSPLVRSSHSVAPVLQYIKAYFLAKCTVACLTQ